jgi:polar amino acid transport system substrate-binding protein
MTPMTVVKSWQATLDGMKADGSFWWIGRKWLPPDALMLATGQDEGQQQSPLTIYTENAPPSTFEEKGIVKGLSAELVKEILGRMGQTDNIQLVPWARGYQAALSEANVALFATTRLPQREALFQWVGPLYQQTWGFYGRKGTKLTVTSLEEAKQVARIGTYRRDAKMQFLKSQGFTNLVPTNRNLTNVQHLIRGDIDLWVSSNFNVQHIVQQAGVDPKEVVLVYPFRQVGNYIAFSRHTSPHRVRLWQSILEEMKTDGEYRRICLSYGYQPK